MKKTNFIQTKEKFGCVIVALFTIVWTENYNFSKNITCSVEGNFVIQKLCVLTIWREPQGPNYYRKSIFLIYFETLHTS